MMKHLQGQNKRFKWLTLEIKGNFFLCDIVQKVIKGNSDFFFLSHNLEKNDNLESYHESWNKDKVLDLNDV